MRIDYYQGNPKFYVSVDCIIFGFREGQLYLLLLNRNFEPEKGKVSLVGGFIQEEETAESAAKRVLQDLTGLEDVYMEQVGTFSALDRDPGERVISVAYFALIDMDCYDQRLVSAHNAYWCPIDEVPALGFDHPQMVAMAMARMRRKVSTNPLGFNLLPEYFTLSQLQSLYESIIGEKIDKRNFRKRVQAMEFIEKTDRIDKTGSRRGATLYRFNERRYQMEDLKFKL